MAKTALITGIAGQDGAYLTQLLLSKGYDVHGVLRWDSHLDFESATPRLAALGLTSDDVTLHMGDVTDANNINQILKTVKPDEIYNLAGLSQVQVSFDTPASTLDINAKGTLNLLDGIRACGMENACRFYQASSSEMFGRAPAPQNEETKMEPCSPYGVAKLAAYHYTRNYREAYGLHASNGILFNHESPLRGEDFVTRKITKAVSEIQTGRDAPLMLGNLDSIRDWGDARDYVEGMWLMLQQPQAEDYVLATGQAHSVREFVMRAFSHVGIRLEWRGEGVNETGVDVKSGKVVVKIDEALFRPAEVHHLLGDASKAREKLCWAPRIGFDDLVNAMMNADRTLLMTDQTRWSKSA